MTPPSHSGVVSAGDIHTAEAGARLLREGGNAVDAAVGASFAAFAAEPVLTGAFGGGFATVAGPRLAPHAFDFFAEVPGRGLPPALEDPALDFVSVKVDFGPTSQVFHCGRAAVAVPLLLPGLVELHQAHGRLPFPRVVQPALDLARDGVPLSDQIGPILKILEPILVLTPGSANIFAPGGRLLGASGRYQVPETVHLLEELAVGDRVPGREPLLEGFGPPHGRLTPADLDAARAVITDPLRVELHEGWEVHLPPPPAAGGLLIAFSLRLLEDVPASVWRDEAALAHHLLAVMFIASEARRTELDPILKNRGSIAAVAATFLDDSHLDRWREPFLRAVREGAVRRSAPEPGLGSTTHVSVIDREGLACAITHSNGEGCGHLVPGFGVQANNFLGEEDLHPHGFHADPPGTRLSSMMCPTLVTREGRPVMAVGSGGSNRIRTAILQVLVYHLLVGRSLRESVESPRIHLEGGVLHAERRGPAGPVSTSVLESLNARVPELVVFDEPHMFFGGAHAVSEDGEGAGDPRRGGAVSRA